MNSNRNICTFIFLHMQTSPIQMQSIQNSLHLDSSMHLFTASNTQHVDINWCCINTVRSHFPFAVMQACIFLKCASHLDSPATMGVPQRRQQVRRWPESWLQSFSMMKWYRFPQTGCPLHPATKQTHQTQDSIAGAVLLYANSIWQGRLNQSWLCMWKQHPNNSLTRRKFPENFEWNGSTFFFKKERRWI